MHCSNCGEPLSNSAKYCASCGAAITEALPDAATETPQVEKKEKEAEQVKRLMKNPIVLVLAGLGIFFFLQDMGFWFDSDSNATRVAEEQTSASAKAGDAVQHELQNIAIRMLHDQNGMLCDRIFDEQLNNVTYGSLSSGGKTRFPAILANYDYRCVNPVAGDVERNTQFWVVFGHDKVGGKYRCFTSAKRSVVERAATGCDFRPG